MSNSLNSRHRLAELDKTLCHAFLVAAAELATGHSYAAKLGKINLRSSDYSPLYGSFINLPPLHFSVGTHDTLLDDTIEISKKAQSQGVDVTLYVADHCFHNWPLYHQLAHESRVAYNNIIEWTNKQFQRNTTTEKQTLYNDQSSHIDQSHQHTAVVG